MDRFVGISIGGTKTSVNLCSVSKENRKVESLSTTVFKTDVNSDIETINKIFEIVDKFDFFSAISIIVGSPLDKINGTINQPPHLPGFKKTPIVKMFNDRYHVRTILTNDADACALAEFYFGAGINTTNMIFFTFGTGFGAGLILNKKLYTGKNSMAGEIGHLSLRQDGPIGYNKKGSVEGFLSGGSIGKYSSIILGKELSTKEVFRLARENDPQALKIVNDIAMYLGETVSIVLDLFNPDMVVIGGIYPRDLALLEAKTIERCKELTLEQNFKDALIVPAALKEEIDLYSSVAPLLEE